ncbi:helix-turn-helix domain-containing protein, partial [Streptomyces lydicus]|uniref:helix-turn-helix domain-containing protein n=1 Tax=Streptomyces lydicus TaxID=47763 RepID=UPI003324A91D
MGAAEEAAGGAALLKEWKDRSGYSYGVLAKRLHMSTSTLHRYCNGDAVPTEYAPLERLARLCRATPGELVELHRRWILADEARRRERDRKQGGGNAPVVERGGERIVGSGANSEAEAGTTSGPGGGSQSEPEADAAGTEPEGVPPTVPVAALAGSAFASGSGQVTSIIPEGRSVRQVAHAGGRQRIALVAGAVVAAVAASAALVTGLVSGG